MASEASSTGMSKGMLDEERGDEVMMKTEGEGSREGRGPHTGHLTHDLFSCPPPLHAHRNIGWKQGHANVNQYINT